MLFKWHTQMGYRIQAATKMDRDSGITFCREAVLQLGGWILDFRMFSNLSLVLTVEIKGGKLLSLKTLLLQAGWKVDLEPKEDEIMQSLDEIHAGTVYVTFAHADGELKIVVPDVPG